jgi:MoxR-like ATPase
VHTSSPESAACLNLRRAIQDACTGLVDREALVELVVLCAVAGEHVLVVGPPGTAKSAAVRRVAQRLGGTYFEYLIGRFTEPSEIFGPISLQKLKEGVVEAETSGMLPEAEIAFLDEVFLGSTAILNTLLGVLNERTFRRGQRAISCPLRVCVGASNRLPEDPQLAAFADRFLVRLFVEPVRDSALEELLAAGWALGDGKPAAGATMLDLDALMHAARNMNLHAVRPHFAHAIRLLRSAGIAWTDRRVVRAQRLIAAAAALAGRSEATPADLWPIVFALPTAEAQRVGRDALRELLTVAENGSLLAAAAEASLGPVARGAKLIAEARSVLDAKPAEPKDLAGWRLRIEGFAREIDASFGAPRMSPELAALREEVVGILAPTAPAGVAAERADASGDLVPAP